METGVAEAFKAFGGYGVVGAVAMLAMALCVYLFRDGRDTLRRWMEERNAIAEKRLEQIDVLRGVIERNTAAHLEATKTNEGRAITLQRLVDDHAEHKRDLEAMKEALNEIKRRGVQ